MGSCQARSVYLTTRLLGRLSPKRLTSIVHILSPETDNCPSWISGRERRTIENISWSISTKECCRPRWGLNLRPPGLQSDEPSRPALDEMFLPKNNYIRILHEGEVQTEKSVPGYLFGITMLAEWDRTVIPGKWFFILYLTPMIGSFSCIPFDFSCIPFDIIQL